MKALRLRIVLALAAHLVVGAIGPTSTAHANGVIGFRREHIPAMVIVPQVHCRSPTAPCWSRVAFSEAWFVSRR